MKQKILRIALIWGILMSLSGLVGCRQTGTDSSQMSTLEIIKQQEKEGFTEPSVGQEKVEQAETQKDTADAETTEQPEDKADSAASDMEVHFIDVGQGDATLVKCGDAAMLIDAGEGSKGTLIQNYLQKQGVKKLDYLVLTHSDSDHIGGAPVIVTKFEIDRVFVSDFEKDNQTYRKLIQALDDKNIQAVTPKAGDEYALADASFRILGPVQAYDDPNNASLVIWLENGENSFLFTGDAKEEAELDILDTGTDVKADVYQAGHHGSRSSSAEKFLDAVNPEAAVISCEEGNFYGHPHAQTLNNLRSRGIKLYRTDEQGSIIAKSDGKKITWNCAPSETWKAGEPTGGSKDAAKSGEAASDMSEKNMEEADVVPETTVPESENAPVVQPVPGQATQQPESEQVVQQPASEQPQAVNELTYVLNVKTKKFHYPSCGSLPTTNRMNTGASREEIIAQGYVPCKKCNP